MSSDSSRFTHWDQTRQSIPTSSTYAIHSQQHPQQHPPVHSSSGHYYSPSNPHSSHLGSVLVPSDFRTLSAIPASRSSSVENYMPSPVLSPRLQRPLQAIQPQQQQQQHRQHTLPPQQLLLQQQHHPQSTPDLDLQLHQQQQHHSQPTPDIQAQQQQQQQQQSERQQEHQQTGSSSSQFWRNPGMKALIDWYTDYDNYKRLNAVRPTPGNKPIDVRKEIAAAVNNAEGTDWTEVTVKSKLQYVRKRYMEAKALKVSSTGEGTIGTVTLDSRVKEICPVYERLATVLSGSLVNNGPPPVQAGSKRGMTFDEDTEEGSDSEGEVSSSAAEVSQSATVPRSGNARSGAKRNKTDDLAEMITRLDSFRAVGNMDRRQHMDSDLIDCLRRQEDSLAVREDNLKKMQATLMDDKVFVKSQLESIDRQRLKDRETLDRDRDTLDRDRNTLDRERDALDRQRDAIDTEKKELKDLANTIEARRKQLEEKHERLTTENTAMQLQLERLKHELDLLRKNKIP
ncbi:hypothetical protein BGZ59_003444 [Podila verticillata]|nr:hypothetical protein BGZ59_003444 [Podila verticillata]